MTMTRSMIAAVALSASAALASPAGAQNLARPQESPWAMRAPAQPIAGATPSRIQVQQMKAEVITPQQQLFADQLILAVRTKDKVKMKELIAPSVLACVGKDHAAFLDARIKKQFSMPVPEKHKVSVSQLPPKVFNNSKYVTYPLMATHVLSMDYNMADGTNVTVNQLIAQEDGKWYEAQPCPTAEGMVRFEKMEKNRKLGEERAKQVFARVQDPLKSQLLALIAKRDNADAWKLCMSQLHVDFQTARAVVSMLSGDEMD